MKPYRLARVAEAIREVASETILYELHDPRVKRVTVTAPRCPAICSTLRYTSRSWARKRNRS